MGLIEKFRASHCDDEHYTLNGHLFTLHQIHRSLGAGIGRGRKISTPCDQ